MAQTFRNAGVDLPDADTTIYECPPDTVAIVIGLQTANVTGQQFASHDVWWTDASNGDAVTYLAESVVIPANAGYAPLSGKLVLEAGDRLRGRASEDESENPIIQATASVLELS